MALVLADLVQENTSTTGTGTLTLTGAVSGYQTFAAIGNANTTYYRIKSGTDSEIGIGTYTSAGTTLSRDTVLYSTAGGTTKITVAGGATVACVYPAEKAVYQDSNGNASVDNLFLGYTDNTAAGTTTALTASSNHYQKISGSTTQTFTLPDATTLPLGAAFVFDNDSTGAVTVNDFGNTLVDTVTSGAIDFLFVENNSTSAGSWGKYSWVPAGVNWGTTTADFNGTTVSNLILQPKAGTATAGTAPVKLTSGTNLTTAEAGAIEYDGVNFYATTETTSGRNVIPEYQQFSLASNVTAFGPASGDFFGATSSASLAATTTYDIECFCYFLKTTAGTAQWIPTFSTAVTVGHSYLEYTPVTGFTTTVITGAMVTAEATQQTTTVLTHTATASLTSAVNHIAKLRIRVLTNTACNFRLKFVGSAGTITPQTGSFYTVRKVASSAGNFVA